MTPEDQGAGAAPPEPRDRARRGWPLSARLTAIFAVLLAIGLVASGVVATDLLRRSLEERLDSQLAQTGPRIVEVVTAGLPDTRTEALLPSDYQVVFFAPDGVARARWASSAASAVIAPDFPGLTFDEVVRRDREPYTIQTAEAGRWRVVSLALTNLRGEALGSAAVALPMADVDATTARLRGILAAIGVAVILPGGVLGWWAVRRSLRPLREIEDVAGAIAAGDLSRRVPPAPPSTEVGRLSTALNAMLAQLEQAFAARTASEERMRRFVADASHELRTPLATIRGYGELVRMGALTTPEEVAGTVRRIEDAASRMGGLVDDLLDLARLDEGRPIASEPVDLAVLAADAAADLRALDHERPISLVALSPAPSIEGAVALGDDARLRQVLANVVGNVARHTPVGTPVELAVGRVPAAHGSGEVAAVEVRDHGPGIDPAQAEKVFERFYRVDAARGRDQGGAGLGLAIVAAIVGAHGGHVRLGATPGGGTTVRVELPLA